MGGHRAEVKGCAPGPGRGLTDRCLFCSPTVFFKGNNFACLDVITDLGQIEFVLRTRKKSFASFGMMSSFAFLQQLKIIIFEKNLCKICVEIG